MSIRWGLPVSSADHARASEIAPTCPTTGPSADGPISVADQAGGDDRAAPAGRCAAMVCSLPARARGRSAKRGRHDTFELGIAEPGREAAQAGVLAQYGAAFWGGKTVERQWWDGRLGRVLGLEDEDHCWVAWHVVNEPAQVEIDCVPADELIAWHRVETSPNRHRGRIVVLDRNGVLRAHQIHAVPIASR